MSRWINRKEIAQLIDFSVTQVRKNEQRLGIGGFKKQLNARCIVYERRFVLEALRRSGFLG